MHFQRNMREVRMEYGFHKQVIRADIGLDRGRLSRTSFQVPSRIGRETKQVLTLTRRILAGSPTCLVWLCFCSRLRIFPSILHQHRRSGNDVEAHGNVFRRVEGNPQGIALPRGRLADNRRMIGRVKRLQLPRQHCFAHGQLATTA